jgi:hypothetical protein
VDITEGQKGRTMTPFIPTHLPLSQIIETQKVLKKAISANRALARLNGTALKKHENVNIVSDLC